MLQFAVCICVVLRVHATPVLGTSGRGEACDNGVPRSGQRCAAAARTAQRPTGACGSIQLRSRCVGVGVGVGGCECEYMHVCIILRVC